VLTATVSGLSALVLVAAFAFLCFWALWVSKDVRKREGRRLQHPRREQPVDLAAERRIFEAERDRHAEEIVLRRAA